MAAGAAEPPHDVPRWIKTLPLAPEYRPTLEEFQDPIAYILQIEDEASEYGICKIVPPIPPAPKKTVISNLNRSLASSIPTSNPKSTPTFTTIEQQIGFGNRTPRAAQKPKWKIGERCSVRQFEAKARRFENSYMKGIGMKRLSPLEIENLFWKATVDDETFAVECASDIPGSAFEPMEGKNLRGAGKGATVGESEWNMGGISRAEGSLLRFMEEEIPGVNSPVLNLSMMFSWFAWHAEDHDLHSLNYLHIGAAKTWYGVPGEAAVAFEEVVGAHGYGGDVNPLVTFAIIGEKTTVMSPEALIDAGIPCCRLVQNAGEFVVTFPRAYHSGFSHGFNCCEATNIATPKWLMVAKEAAIRRASINRPPVVSHFQLLYALALSLRSRVPKNINTKPRSFRVKHKEKIEGETIVKELFVLNVMQNNDLLHVLLEQGSSCVLLHQNFLDGSECSNSPARTKTKMKPKLSIGLCSLDGEIEASKGSLSNDTIQDLVRPLTRFYSVRKRSSFVSEGDKPPSSVKHDQFGDAELCSLSSERQDMISEKESTSNGYGLSGQELFTCVACGISSSACSAVIQPREAAAQYLRSAEFSFFNDWLVGSGALDDRLADDHGNGNASEPNTCSDSANKTNLDDLYDVPVRPSSYLVLDRRVEVPSEAEAQRNISSLDLLAVAYGNSSDSDEDPVGAQIPRSTDENEIRDSSLLHKQNERSQSAHGVVSSQSKFSYDNSTSNGFEQDDIHKEAGNMYHTSFRLGCGNAVPFQIYKHTSASFRDQEGGSTYFRTRSKESHKSEMENLVLWESKSLKVSCRDRIATPGKVIDQSVKGRSGEMKSERAACDSAELSNCSHEISKCAPASFSETNKHSNVGKPMKNTDMLVKQLSEGYSSKNHIFCLEHAVEVEKQLRSIGGVHVLVLCHPEYPKVVAGAKSFSEELGIDYLWKDVPFREATMADQERIQSALDSEEARPRNEDWVVKLGISLSYFARLSHSPLYRKKMPFNSVIYKAFGCSSPARSSMKSKVSSKRLGKRNKPSVVGRWCGKVWMSNQVNPYLAQRGTNEEEPSANVDSQAIPEAKAEKKRHSNCLYEQTPDPEQNILPNADTCSARKAGKKRKTVSTKGASKKPKYLQLDSSIEGVKDSPKSTSPKQLQRTLRSRLPKREMGQRCDYKAKNNLQNDSKAKEECAGGPIGRLRRSSNPPQEDKPKSASLNQCRKKDNKKALNSCKEMPSNSEMKYQCNMDGCTMGFRLKQELVLHKSNICPVKGCGKKFFAHKYLVQHKRVHVDDRPLKCPWKGCKMTFKWPWARTEHIRVHTGVRPYVCREPGCGQTFRFVSDFSRHKRKTGHSGKKKGKGRG